MATKTTARRKSPAKKTTARKSTAAKAPKNTAKINDPKLAKDVVRLRDKEDLTWSEIADRLGVGNILVQLVYMKAKVKPSERITAKNESEMGKKIRAARDKEKQSWGWIAARCDLPESKVRSLYAEAGGNLEGNRIGKGGRYAGDQRPKGAKTTAKKTPAKKSTAKKSTAKKTTAKKTTGSPRRRRVAGSKTAKAGGSTKSSGHVTPTKSTKAPKNTDPYFQDAHVDTVIAKTLPGKTISIHNPVKGTVTKMEVVTAKVGKNSATYGRTMAVTDRSQKSHIVPVAHILDVK